jgi:hypothetical protein
MVVAMPLLLDTRKDANRVSNSLKQAVGNSYTEREPSPCGKVGQGSSCLCQIFLPSEHHDHSVKRVVLAISHFMGQTWTRTHGELAECEGHLVAISLDLHPYFTEFAESFGHFKF